MSSLLNVVKTNYILLMQIFIKSLQLNMSSTVFDTEVRKFFNCSNNNYHKFCTSQILKLHQNSLTQLNAEYSKSHYLHKGKQQVSSGDCRDTQLYVVMPVHSY